MTFNPLFAVLAALFGAVLMPQPARAQNPTCSPTVKAHHKQKIHCGEFGHLVRPALLSTSTVLNQDACTTNCLSTSGKGKCISFGYNSNTMECRLYTQTLTQQKYVDRATQEGFVYYNRNCFTTKCTPCTPSQPTGDFVVNGDFECGLDPWVAFTNDGQTTGDIGMLIPGNHAYVVTTPDDFVDSGTGAVQYYLYQVLAIEPRTQYTMTFDAYFENVDDIFSIGVNSAGLLIEATPSTVGQFYTYTIPITTSDDQSYIFFSYYIPTAGAVIGVDNVSVELATPLPCTAGVPLGTDLIYNGAFDCTFAGWFAGTSTGIEVFTNTPISATDYAFEIRVLSSYDPAEHSPKPAGLTQAIVTIPAGVSAVLSIDVLSQVDGNGLLVSLIPGSDFQTTLLNSPNFETYSTVFTGDGNSYTLYIYGQPAGPSQSIFFDNISLTPIVD